MYTVVYGGIQVYLGLGLKFLALENNKQFITRNRPVVFKRVAVQGSVEWSALQSSCPHLPAPFIDN